jgi:hypothetical protein
LSEIYRAVFCHKYLLNINAPKIPASQNRFIKVQIEKLEFFYLKCHLSCENEFVAFKQSPSGVEEDGVGDAVDQVVDPEADLLGRRCPFDGLLEHHAESLRAVA